MCPRSRLGVLLTTPPAQPSLSLSPETTQTADRRPLPAHASPPRPGAHQLPGLAQGPQGCRALAAAPGLWGAAGPQMTTGVPVGPHGVLVLPAPAPEPSDPRGRECLLLLQQLHGRSQQLLEVTEESLHSLRERLRHPDTVGLGSLLLLHGAEGVLRVHLE